MFDDFTDLRAGRLSTDSFWPSFTDIMTVVVMIFLITSVVLMVRNWELIDQLKESLVAEQKAREIISFTTEENATLEEQLAQTQHELSIVRMRLMQAAEENENISSTLADKEQQIIVLLSDNQRLEGALANTTQQVASLQSRLQQVIVDMDKLKNRHEETTDRLSEAENRIVILSEEKDSKSRKLAKLETDYSSLKVKYDKLVKPARSARGKYVVTVNYQKINGEVRIRFKDSGDEAYTRVNEKELYKKLSDLKKKHPKNLYIKMIIPEESGLSYSEAWTFMKELLNKYDYYYQ